MLSNNTDREWEKFGTNDPYFGVITHEKYHRSKLTGENRDEFFKSGEKYIDKVLENIRKNIDPAYSPKKALDFGCGVGRLVIPLARIANHVIGVDVSQSMIEEAKKNCESRMITNVELIKSNNDVLSLDGKYDLINSYNVFQHIPVKRGEHIFDNLLTHVEDGGVCVLHFTYKVPWGTTLQWMRDHIPFAHNFFNIIKGRNYNAPVLQMNPYDINHLFGLMQNYNISEFYAEFTQHSLASGILLYFVKPAKA